MKYCFCTIAIGQKYFDSAINFAKDLNQVSKNHEYIIISNKTENEIPNTKIIPIDKNETLFIGEFFNYNLKYIPIKFAKKMGYEFIIFVDADWKINNTYSEESMYSLFEYMKNNNLDFLFERPHLIGHGKHQGNESFWRHKISFYNLLETDVYDSGHVANEQFLLFKNNKKLDMFLDKWESLEKIATKENLWPFAEGVEIGMSSAISKMNYNFNDWKRFLQNMFSFTTVDGRFFNRF